MIAALLTGGGLAAPVAAEPLTMTINYTADVGNSCTYDTSQSDTTAGLGNVGETAATVVSTRIYVTCSSGLVWTMTGTGRNDDGADPYQHFLKSAAGDRIPYQVSVGTTAGVGQSTPLPKTNSSVSETASGTPFFKRVFFSVPAAAGRRVTGAYTDTLTITMTW